MGARRLLPALVGAMALFAAGAAHAGEPLALRVVSYNCWGVPYITPERPERMQAIGEHVAELAPDLVALQEVWEPEDAAIVGATLAAAGLTYQRHFVSEEQESGLWIGSRYPIESWSFVPFELGEKPNFPWHLDYLAQKGVAIARVITPAGVLELANTHLQATYAVGDYDLVQLGQALQTSERLGLVGEARAPEGLLAPLIATGDLNVDSSSLAFRALATRAALTPAVENLGIEALFARPGSSVALELRRMQRVLDGPVTLANGHARRLSDHPALLADYELRSCSDCLAHADHGRWPGVAREVLAQLRTDTERTRERLTVTRALGFVMPLLALAVAWQSRRRRGPARLIGWASALGLLLVTGWIHYWAWDFDPWKLERLAALHDRLANAAAPDAQR